MTDVRYPIKSGHYLIGGGFEDNHRNELFDSVPFGPLWMLLKTLWVQIFQVDHPSRNVAMIPAAYTGFVIESRHVVF